MTMKRHFGKYRGEEVVVIGYNKSMNTILLVRYNALPSDEAADLIRIAQSTSAQNLDYLIPTLRVERHKSNQDWFTHLAHRLHRNDGSVVSVSIKEVEELNDEQKAFFKGYGAAIEPEGGPSSRVGADDEFSLGVTDTDENLIINDTPEGNAPLNLAQAEAMNPNTVTVTTATPDPTQTVLLETLKTINETLAQQSAVLAAQGEAIAKLKPAKTTRKKRATKKKVVAKSVPETTQEQDNEPGLVWEKVGNY